VTCSQSAAMKITSRFRLNSECRGLNMDIHKYRSETTLQPSAFCLSDS
jgi:hypothetical protein